MNESPKSSNPIISAVIVSVVLFGGILLCAGTSMNVRSSAKDSLVQTAFSGTHTETETEVIPFETQYINDNTLEYGQSRVRTEGINGEKTLEYKVTYDNDVIVSKELVGEKISIQPVNKVVANGTKIIWHCIDVTSYDKNPYNDNYCKSSTGEGRYVPDSQARALDPTYSPGQSGHSYYNSF